ncbi:Protein of unknown function [Jiangella alba]|uniref:DUF3631 domain-containing protein n=2 Tax=Jiangella alba TaxID=561176 RepID=A0A1H5PIK2_9ACTN|nr:Protein of unknown function [Jiangella alba]
MNFPLFADLPDGDRQAIITEFVSQGGDTNNRTDLIQWIGSNKRLYANHEALYYTLGEARVTGGPPDDLAALTSEVLDEVYAFTGRFIAYPSDDAHVAHVLWIAHTWLMDVWDSTPRIAFLSTEPGSGKSRCLEVTEPLVPKAVHAFSATPAYLVRKIATDQVTVLFDEVDTIFGPKTKDNHEDVRAVLNAGHRRGAVVGRCTKGAKGQMVTEELPAYAAVALAGLGNLPDTILTRSVVIRMRRRSTSEQVEPWRERRHKAEAALIAKRLEEWSNFIRPKLTEPEMPEGIEDRNADVWEPLLAVSDQAKHGFGKEWPLTSRVSAVSLVSLGGAEAQSLGVKLLDDIRNIFNSVSVDRVPSEWMITALNQLEESPWATMKGGSLDARRLAYHLRKYDIGPKQVRFTDGSLKGYMRVDFEDAWSRYL